AAELTSQILSTRVEEGAERARIAAHKALGQILFDKGDIEGSIRSLAAAREIAISLNQSDPDLLSAVNLARWRLFARLRPLQLSHSEFSEVRRTVLHSGNLHHLLELRIWVAEIEARQHSPHEAIRHLSSALHSLSNCPNAWLEGIAFNHLGLIYGVLGD